LLINILLLAIPIAAGYSLAKIGLVRVIALASIFIIGLAVSFFIFRSKNIASLIVTILVASVAYFYYRQAGGIDSEPDRSESNVAVSSNSNSKNVEKIAFYTAIIGFVTALIYLFTAIL